VLVFVRIREVKKVEGEYSDKRWEKINSSRLAQKVR
jgi:hypothetical protein